MTADFVHPDVMTAGQREKRQLLLEATLRLLESSHPEAIGVKDVATESGIALATLYRFFHSKDHLMAAAMLFWEGRLGSTRISELNSDGLPASTEERVIEVLRRASRSYLGRPHMLALLIAVATTRDPYAMELGAELRLEIRTVLVRQMMEFEESQAHLFSEVIQALWFDMLVHWHAGRVSMTDGLDQASRAIMVFARGLRAAD